LILPSGGTYAKTEIFFFSSARYGEKDLSDFQNSFLFARNPSRKKTSQTSKNGGFGEVSGMSDPPKVVSGIGRGGSDFT
jgi:hypothetical protein